MVAYFSQIASSLPTNMDGLKDAWRELMSFLYGTLWILQIQPMCAVLWSLELPQPLTNFSSGAYR